MFFGQLSFFYDEQSIKYLKHNQFLRKKINLKPYSNKKNLLNFIINNLKYLIPKDYIENFKNIKLLSQTNILPKKPNFIFTSNLYSYDEIFKFYTGE